MVESEKPPVFKSWKGWYVFILLVLAIQVVLYRVLTVVFS